MEKFAVIIAGSRDFEDYDFLEAKCNYLFSNRRPTEIVCGKARGADTLGEQYAFQHDIPVKYFPADWDTYGKSAGYRRNAQMAEYGDALIAFWDGKSKGTKHMIDLAKSHNLKIRIIKIKQK